MVKEQPLVKDCHFGLSPVNYSDSDLGDDDSKGSRSPELSHDDQINSLSNQ